MPCIGIGNMIVCTRGARRARCRCGALSAYQCDGPAPARKSGTCDAHLCAHHAKQIGPDRHLCPTCAAKPVAAPPPAPKPSAQLELFVEARPT